MNIKNNGRKKKSVEKIEKAYMELLQTAEAEDITISEISEKAEINRSTFYQSNIVRSFLFESRRLCRCAFHL